MVAIRKPFFPFKNRLSQSYRPYSSASIIVKTGFPDPVNFATTRLLLPRLWYFRQSPLAVLAHRAGLAAICQWSHKHCVNYQHLPYFFVRAAKSLWSFFPRLWQFAQLLYDHWHIAAVTAPYANELKAKS
jgi:hypothetical protein